MTLSTSKTLRSIRKWYLGFAFLFVIIICWKNFPETKDLTHHLSKLPISAFIQSLALAIGSYFCRSLRWFRYMRLKECNASLSKHTLIYLSGFSFTASPGKVGELMRATHLSQLGVPFKFTFFSFVSERLLDIIVVACLGSYFLATHFNNSFFTLPVGLLLACFTAYPFLTWVNGLKTHLPIEELKSLWNPLTLSKNLPVSFLAWLLQGIVLYTLLISLGVEIDLMTAISIYCLSLLIGAASLIPSGIGVTEIGMVWLLTQIQVDNDIALIASIVTRGLTLWPAMMIGLVSAITLQQASKNGA